MCLLPPRFAMSVEEFCLVFLLRHAYTTCDRAGGAVRAWRRHTLRDRCERAPEDAFEGWLQVATRWGMASSVAGR